ncbi:hypothetical protein GTV15_11160 [Streptomyces sp. SID7803]|nr:hypothetical protein [Streptomyces sp. SID7803]
MARPPPRNLAAGPDVLSCDGRAPTPRVVRPYARPAGAPCAPPHSPRCRLQAARSGSAQLTLGTDERPVPQARRARTPRRSAGMV